MERAARRVSDSSFNCTDCRALLQRYVSKTLESHSDVRVEEHLAHCHACFDRYATLVEEDIRKNRRESYLAGRPQPWSPPWDRNKEKSVYDEIMAQAVSTDREAGGHLTFIKYDKPLERSAFMLLLRVVAGLRNQGKRVRLFSSPTECLIYPEELDVLKRPLCLVFLRGSGFCNALESLQDLSRRGISIIAGWPNDEWGELTPLINHHSYWFNLESRYSDAFDRALRDEMEAERALLKAPSKDMYLYTCLLDAYGIPAPLPLLARLIAQSERKTAALLRQAKGLIWPVETRLPSRGSFCTAGEPIARLALTTVFADEAEHGYSRIVEAIDPAYKDERHLLLRLVRSMTLRGKRHLARRLLTTHERSITGIWQRGEIREILLWGTAFHDLFLYDRAETVFRYGLEREPENAHLLQALAGMLYDSGKHEEGERLFDKASRTHPDNVYIWQSWGDKERKLGRLHYGESRLRKALELEPANVYTLVSYGSLELERGRLDEAQRLFEKALGIAPQNTHALNCMAELVKRKGGFLQAKALLEQALDAEPGSVPSLHALGQLEKERGHFSQAKQLFTTIVDRFDEDNTRTLHALGEIELEKGRLKQEETHYALAEEHFKAVLDIEPGNTPTLVSVAVMEGYRGNYAGAEALLSAVLEKRPDNLRARVALAEVRLRQGRHREAEESLVRVLQVMANNVAALNTYARLHAARGDYELAAKVFQQALQQERQSVVTCNTWAEVEAGRGNFDKAAELINIALDLDPENAYTYRQYSSILDRQGKHEEARQQLVKAIKLGMDI